MVLVTVRDVRKAEAQMMSSLQHVKLLKGLVKAVTSKDIEVATAALHSCRRFFVRESKKAALALRDRPTAAKKRKSKRQRRAEAVERSHLAAQAGGAKPSPSADDTAAGDTEQSPADKLRAWTVRRYRDFLRKCAELVLEGEEEQQVLALRSAIQCIALDAPFVAAHAVASTFGHQSMQALVQAITLADEPLSANVLAVLRDEHLNAHADVRCSLLRAIATVLNGLAKTAGAKAALAEAAGSDSGSSSGAGSGSGSGAGAGSAAGTWEARRGTAAARQAAENAFDLLLQVRMLPEAAETSDMTLLAEPLPGGDDGAAVAPSKPAAGRGTKRGRAGDSDGDSQAAEDGAGANANASAVGIKATKAAYHQRTFAAAWIALLSRPLSPVLYRKVLLVLPSRVIPCMANPLALADFLTDSYNLGGVASVLALQSLFDLIMKHDLDYPDFFEKLYLLLQPSVLSTKYRARFLRLLGSFLASPLMPAYIVAAFAKRLMWMALHGTPASGLYVSALVYNLLQRHPTVLPMIQRSRKSKSLARRGTDAFVPPPALSVKSKVVKSSLYEIKGLRSHYCPSLSSLASVFEKTLDKPRYNLAEFATHTYSSLFDAECDRQLRKAGKRGGKAPEIPRSFKVPTTVFGGDDSFVGCFADVPVGYTVPEGAIPDLESNTDVDNGAGDVSSDSASDDASGSGSDSDSESGSDSD